MKICQICDLSGFVQENTTLEIFDISMNGFGSYGAACLGAAIRLNKSLIYLDISNNRICIEGAARFGKLFSHNTTLQTLKVCHSSPGSAAPMTVPLL